MPEITNNPHKKKQKNFFSIIRCLAWGSVVGVTFFLVYVFSFVFIQEGEAEFFFSEKIDYAVEWTIEGLLACLQYAGLNIGNGPYASIYIVFIIFALLGLLLGTVVWLLVKGIKGFVLVQRI